MSKIESGENRMNIETFDLTEQIREIDMLIYAKYRFVITDNGIGMKKEYLEHIFEPFSCQENSVTNRVQGTGLGMTITKNIVDMMSGIIQVESEEGKESTFEVIFEFRIDKEKEKSSPAQPRKNEINSGESDIQQSLAAGMNAHISKPMDMGVLRKTVVKVISETSVPAGTPSAR